MVEPHTAELERPIPTADMRGTVVIVNPQGLHMRPASAFAAPRSRSPRALTSGRADQCVNGKSLIDLLMLAADPGTELEVEVHGSDAARRLCRR